MLHRDISVGNVMIDAQGRGVLNDWDSSGPLPNSIPGRKIAVFRAVCVLMVDCGVILLTPIRPGNLAVYGHRSPRKSRS